MELEGTIHDGVAVPDGECSLPEGTKVRITPDGPAVRRRPNWDRLIALARKVEQMPCDLPEDLSENHDHYLHGQPKSDQ